MHTPEMRTKESGGLVFAIPPVPLYNEHGFALLPVVPGQESGQVCLVCGKHCQPNSHHAYWPRPARSEAKRKARAADRRLAGALDFTKDPYRALRSASFAVSQPVCSRWHHAIHAVQTPPKDAPDKPIIQAALDQHTRIVRSADVGSKLTALLKSGRSNIKHITAMLHTAEAIRTDLPAIEKILFPTLGYTCSVDVDRPFSMDVVSYDLTFAYGAVERAIGLAKKRLS